ncbi:hypothetical protein F4775DRAFT_586841 [Biscogniauxia sp. FL1348]|nr:hypothetical protein F4775DRAFT_586841 [Biscogniauxia sp. FL1348]
MLSLDPMATASSQPPANPANTPSIAAVRASSASAPPPSESPAIPAPSPSLPGSVPNGSANGFIPTTAMPGDGSINTDMRLYPRDGRVRNPVPSKLKDVNERMKGNFGVMHMDVASHRASEGRDAAAKRTSESTALQAKLAQTDTYVSHQRRANYPRATGLKQFSSPTKKSDDPAPDPGPAPRIPLTMAETKSEQARLLTLLRTLSPNLVVDQICKALAFFGGIPDAPPPTDGKFPESAESNGPGSLFVGWIAEIFPNLERPRRSTLSSAPPPSVSQRRPRGRPKGSKASKARSDKGIKKGSQKTSKGTENQAEDAQDESWVDVEDSVLELNDNGDLVEAESSVRNAPMTATPATGSTGGFRSINDTSNGSKNRPKDNFISQTSMTTESASANNHLSTQATNALGTSSQAPPPKVTPVPKKSNSGRPKGTKNRTKPANETTTQDASTFAAINPGLADSFTPATNGTAGQNKQNKQTHLPVQSGAPTLTTTQPSPLPPTTHQRKRQGINPIGSTSKGETQPTIPQGISAPQMQSHPSQPEQHQPISGVTPIPPAKRSRKSQESNSTPIMRRQTPNNSIGQKSSSVPQSSQVGLEAHYAAMQSRTDQIQSYNNSRPQQKQQHPPTTSMGNTASSISASNQTPAEGLEAHYERFAALQTFQDNSRQASTSRQQKQPQTSQTASPISAQTSKTPQLSAALASQQQARASQGYYTQAQTLSSSYNAQQPSYPTNQRQQPHMASGSPGTALVQHSNSPLMQADNSYRGSPSLVHNTAAFAPRRTPSASPLDSSAYRPASTTSHGLSSHSPHFSTRQPPTTHSTSHPGLPTSFSSFSDPSFIDMQSLDSGNSHSSLGLGTGSYSLGSGSLPQQQRTSSSSAATLYTPATAMNTNYLGSSSMGRASQNRWPS